MPTPLSREDYEVLDLHAQGIAVVALRLLKQGFRLISLTPRFEFDPQIIATRGGREFHFAIRTARQPGLGDLECEELRQELRNWATRHEAACYLVRVGISDYCDERPTADVRFERLV